MPRRTLNEIYISQRVMKKTNMSRELKAKERKKFNKMEQHSREVQKKVDGRFLLGIFSLFFVPVEVITIAL